MNHKIYQSTFLLKPLESIQKGKHLRAGNDMSVEGFVEGGAKALYYPTSGYCFLKIEMACTGCPCLTSYMHAAT